MKHTLICKVGVWYADSVAFDSLNSALRYLWLYREVVRQFTIDWQSNFDTKTYSYDELAACQQYFERLGQKYGLTAEFRENGIV